MSSFNRRNKFSYEHESSISIEISHSACCRHKLCLMSDCTSHEKGGQVFQSLSLIIMFIRHITLANCSWGGTTVPWITILFILKLFINHILHIYVMFSSQISINKVQHCVNHFPSETWRHLINPEHFLFYFFSHIGPQLYFDN